MVFSDLNGQKLTVNNEDDEYTEPHGPNIERDLRHLSDFQYRQSLLNKTCFNNKIWWLRHFIKSLLFINLDCCSSKTLVRSMLWNPLCVSNHRSTLLYTEELLSNWRGWTGPGPAGQRLVRWNQFDTTCGKCQEEPVQTSGLDLCPGAGIERMSHVALFIKEAMKARTGLRLVDTDNAHD